VSAMGVVRSLKGVEEGLGRTMQEMDGTMRGDTWRRGWGQVRGWVAKYSILSRMMGRAGVVGMGEGVGGQPGTFDGRSDDSAAVVQSIGLAGPWMI
jgi:hypothetical protein